MATTTIINKSGSYITIRVEFGDNVFEQLIVSNKTGAALQQFVDTYGNTYETEWNALEINNTEIE